MKVTVDIDCTPEEARRFMGLPDVTPLQDKMMEALEKRMLENMEQMNPAELMKNWMGGAGTNPLQGWQDMQKQFWEQMRAQMAANMEGAMKAGKK